MFSMSLLLLNGLLTDLHFIPLPLPLLLPVPEELPDPPLAQQNHNKIPMWTILDISIKKFIVFFLDPHDFF
jgi:hypothetical protein